MTSGGDAGAGCGGAAEAIYGSRDSNNEIISRMGYAYRLTGIAALKTLGDDIFGGTWGGEMMGFGANGPGRARLTKERLTVRAFA